MKQLPSSISSAHQPQLLRLQPIEDFKLQRDSASDSFTHLNATSIKRCEMNDRMTNISQLFFSKSGYLQQAFLG